MLADRQSLGADLLDSLVHAEARLGDIDAALLHIQEAIKLVPKDYGFWTNKGWYQLMRGELDDADAALKKALLIKPKDPVASGNLTILQYLRTHPHPSGDPAPSREDRDCIARLVKAGGILGIRVLDHIICGATDYYSFADAGTLGDSLP
jgi:tetratricopeptide (TPR) repeat protein